MGSGALWPQLVAGRRPAAFSRLGSERSGRNPSRFFPFSLPWTKSMGFIFISFASVPTCLPMLSPFHICNPCSKRESFQTRNLSSYKDSNPPCCPRSASNGAGRKKGKHGGYLPPNLQLGCRLVAMGTTARLTPRLTHCSGPWTSSVGSPHIGHDTSWRHPSGPKTSWAVTYIIYIFHLQQRISLSYHGGEIQETAFCRNLCSKNFVQQESEEWM